MRLLARRGQRERRLIEAARRDRSAFRPIYLAHADAVFAYLVRRVRDPSLAEDLTADTFERALARIGKFEWRGAPLRAWLLRIADRAATDWLRRAHRRPMAELPPDDLLPNRPSAEQGAVRRERNAQIVEAINVLPAAQRQVVLMRLGEGVGHAEIARRLGRSEGAVRMLYTRGLRRVRGYLDEP